MSIQKLQIKYGENAAYINIGIRVFHFFTVFEIKNAWGLIWWGFGHNEKIQNYFLIMTSH